MFRVHAVAALALLVVLGLAVSAGALSCCPLIWPLRARPPAPFLLSYVTCQTLSWSSFRDPAGVTRVVTDAGWWGVCEAAEAGECAATDLAKIVSCQTPLKMPADLDSAKWCTYMKEYIECIPSSKSPALRAIWLPCMCVCALIVSRLPCVRACVLIVSRAPALGRGKGHAGAG
jgi:hypothetical protein